ncbi:MAG: pentapeptide repeat-containing protein, partial [Spongiibacteraceae bacterium]
MNDVQSDSGFWQNADVDKSQSDNLLQALEGRAARGTPMLGFQLAHRDLAGINLVNAGESTGFDMLGCDFYRSDLRGAHLFAINLRGSSLMKADLRGANLHCADLRDCNLLGAKLDGAQLANVEWGEKLLQEKLGEKALKAGDNAAGLDLYEQAEEVYRMLRLQLERDGLFEEAGRFYCKEMVARRKQLPRFSYARYL